MGRFISSRLPRRIVVLLGFVMIVGGTSLPGMLCAPTTDGGGADAPPGSGNSGVTGKYVGSERCSQCHARIHEGWLDTLHAKALTALEEIGQGSNPDCLGCHTVGFGEEGGFVDRATTNVLGNVGCESCHGPGRDHVMNVTEPALRPKISISATVCGKCHTGPQQPNFEQWQQSKHALVELGNANDYAAGGTRLNSCGKCHSGDFRYLSVLKGEAVQNDYLKGLTRAQMHGITCAICHDPHRRTGNAPFADAGRDYQLRYREVNYPVPTNTVDAAVNPERFNICGQCHHSREATWQTTSRGPHHSVQANVFAGEMPIPEGLNPLVLSMNSPHSLVQEQCATCHMYRQDFQSEISPAISGHTFEVNFNGCLVGCHIHPSAQQAQTAFHTLRNQVTTRLNAILAALNDWGTTNFANANYWKYSQEGGAADQSTVPDFIKQARFLYSYILADGSSGIHNPVYVKAMLTRAEQLLGI